MFFFNCLDSDFHTKTTLSIDNLPLSWFENDLLDRKHLVQLKRELSDEHLWCASSRYSGTVIVYNICQQAFDVNDLNTVCPRTEISLYGDDTVIKKKDREHAEI